MSDWMARPSGRFLVWWLYMVGTLAAIAVFFGLMTLVKWMAAWLTGSEAVGWLVGGFGIITAVAAFNAWLWTATGNRFVQRMIRMMQRMEGRS